MIKFVFTCEHGGNKIPLEFAEMFNSHKTLLNSHYGYDIGILPVFKNFVNHFEHPYFYSEFSRLLIELNRSLYHPKLFSDITRPSSKEIRSKLIEEYYIPYRTKVESAVSNQIKNNSNVIHLSFHSFTAELKGKIRNADIGLLYDPKSKNEKEFSINWKRAINKNNSALNVRFNYPYLGTADGFTSHLRKKFGLNYYCGIELEINQNLLRSVSQQNIISELLLQSFTDSITE